MRSRLAVLASVCVLMVVGVSACWSRRAASAADADLLPSLVQGCKDAIGAVKPGKGKVSVHVTHYSYDNGQKVTEVEATYSVAFDGTKYKIVGEQTYIRNEIGATQGNPVTAGTKLPVQLACDGKRLLEYNARTGSARVGSVTTSAMRSVHESFLTTEALPVDRHGAVSGHGFFRIDYFPVRDDEEDLGLKVAGRESLDGHECIVVERRVERPLKDGGKLVFTREFLVDPKRGYMVPRVREWQEGGPYARKELLLEIKTELREYGRDVWGPAKWTFVQYAPDGKGGTRLGFRRETTYDTAFRFNTRVTAKDLTIKLPSRTRATDLDADTKPQGT